MLCSAVKNKKSEDRCTSKALINIQFCGKHAKCKFPNIWKEKSDTNLSATTIQKIWKGWNIRRLISLAGKYTISARKCHNEEDVVTMDLISKIHPFNYFDFEENGLIYGFDVRSLYQMTLSNLKPSNPYTRQEITIDTRKRLKEYINKRERKRLCSFHDPNYLFDPVKAFDTCWMMISQMLEESLFLDFNPLFFTALNRLQLYNFTFDLQNEIKNWAFECNIRHSTRFLFYVKIRACLRRQTFEEASSHTVVSYLGGTLLRMLKNLKEPHDLCFKILSARYRL